MSPLVTWLLVLVATAAVDVSGMGEYENYGCFSKLQNFDLISESASQSVLTCYRQCNQSYSVFALQGGSCYCGKAVPAAGLRASTCNTRCPGYDGDHCGGDGVYNIYTIKNAEHSTFGASSSSSSASSSNSASEPSSSSVSGPDSTTQSSESNSNDIKETSSTQGSNSRSQSHTATSSAHSRSTSNPSSPSESSSATDRAHHSGTPNKDGKNKSGLSGGAIAGIVVGVILGLALVAALILYLLWKRRQGSDDDEYYSPEGSPINFKSEFAPKEAEAGANTAFQGGYNNVYPVDPRLNPRMLAANSRVSLASLADARDYSRQILKVANPDQ